MVTVVERFGGTIVEFIGDAILVVFGAPGLRDDDTDRAIRCAIEMQRAMPGINQANVAQGLPRIEMGVAVHAGEAIVGNIGSQRRTKYGVVGAAVNSAARLEGYTVGGQILITTAVRQATSCALELGGSVEVQAKGLAQSLEAFELLGIEGGPVLPDTDPVADLLPLEAPEQLHYRFVDTERVEDSTHLARVVGASAQRVAVIPDRPLRMFSELCFCFDLSSFSEPRAASYAKVIGRQDDGEGAWLLHFTSLSPVAQQVVDSWLLQVTRVERRPSQL
jgi:hypothetical protein